MGRAPTVDDRRLRAVGAATLVVSPHGGVGAATLVARAALWARAREPIRHWPPQSDPVPGTAWALRLPLPCFARAAAALLELYGCFNSGCRIASGWAGTPRPSCIAGMPLPSLIAGMPLSVA